MATTNFDAANMAGIADGGTISESVMQQIFDISTIPLPFSDLVADDGNVKNSYHEWTIDSLVAPDITNAVVDGSDQDAVNDQDGANQARVGNHNQISTKTVAVSTRAREVDGIGFADQLAYAVMQKQKELRRDVEAIHMTGQASLADDGAAVAGTTGGLAAWLTSNTDRGVAGVDGGYGATSPGIVDAETEGNKRGLTETLVRDMSQQVWEGGGDPSILMSLPGIIRGFSEYSFTSSARISTLVSDQASKSGSLTAQGSVGIWVTDFGVTLEMIPNRLQQSYVAADTGAVGHVFFLDPGMLAQGFLHSYRTEPLAKVGLSDKRMMSVDHTLIVKNESAHGLIADIDPTIAVIQ